MGGDGIPTVRDVLNAARWRDGTLAGLEITYVHRGAPGDARTVRGEDVARLGSWFFELAKGGRSRTIPYHRILRVERAGEPLWTRDASKG